MRCRVLISFLIFLTGAAGLAADTLDLGKKNTQFQPGQAVQPAVLRPAQVKVGTGAKHFAGVTVQKITPIAQMPAHVELGQAAFREPCEAKIQTAVQPVAKH